MAAILQLRQGALSHRPSSPALDPRPAGCRSDTCRALTLMLADGSLGSNPASLARRLFDGPGAHILGHCRDTPVAMWSVRRTGCVHHAHCLGVRFSLRPGVTSRRAVGIGTEHRPDAVAARPLIFLGRSGDGVAGTE